MVTIFAPCPVYTFNILVYDVYIAPIKYKIVIKIYLIKFDLCSHFYLAKQFQNIILLKYLI